MFSKPHFSLKTLWARAAGVSAFVTTCALLAGCAHHAYPVYYAPPPVVIVHHYAPPPVVIVHHGYGGYGYGGGTVVHMYHNSPYGYHSYGSGGGVVHVYHHYRH